MPAIMQVPGRISDIGPIPRAIRIRCAANVGLDTGSLTCRTSRPFAGRHNWPAKGRDVRQVRDLRRSGRQPGWPMGLTDSGASAGADLTDEVLRAIAEPRRRSILQLVATGELSAGEIAGAFDVTRTAISQHLTVLRNAELIADRRQRPTRLSR